MTVLGLSKVEIIRKARLQICFEGRADKICLLLCYMKENSQRLIKLWLDKEKVTTQKGLRTNEKVVESINCGLGVEGMKNFRS